MKERLVMAWIPIDDSHEPYVFDEQTGERIATSHRYQNMQEPEDHMWSRTCVMALAPELHHALADMVLHAKHHFPEPLRLAIEESERVLSKVKEFYDRRGIYTPPGGAAELGRAHEVLK
jgi:hypothetical protein